MSIDIRLPNITSTDEAGQMEQIRSYLYQLVQQLNYELNANGSGDGGSSVNMNTLKSLITSSTDIINSLTSQVKTRLDTAYVSSNEFGTYIRLGNIDTDMEGNPVYGVEIIHKEQDKTSKIARFVNGSTTFYGLGVVDTDMVSAMIDGSGVHGTIADSLVDSDLFAYAQECINGMTPINLVPGVANVPESYESSIGYIHKRSQNQIAIHLTNINTGSEAVNIYKDGTWLGWKYITPQ